MTKHIALLRAVNLGPHQKVSMPALEALLDALGFTDVKTLLQSGNAVFTADEGSTSTLEAAIEAAVARDVGVATPVMVRSAAQWAEAVARNPFPDEAERDPGHLVLMCLKGPARDGGEAALRAAIKGREAVRVVGAHAYAVYPDGIGASKVTAPMIERHLGAAVTGRNWNTVRKLAAAVQGVSGG